MHRIIIMSIPALKKLIINFQDKSSSSDTMQVALSNMLQTRSCYYLTAFCVSTVFITHNHNYEILYHLSSHVSELKKLVHSLYTHVVVVVKTLLYRFSSTPLANVV